MSGNCPLCGAPLNLGLNFCVVCGRRSTCSESSKIVGLRSATRQSDMTARLDLNDPELKQGLKKAGKPLRFRKVRGLWTQVFYVFTGVSLFFCAVRFALDPKSFHEGVQRTVHTFMDKDSIKNMQGMLGLQPQQATVTKPASAPPKKAKKKKARSRKRAHSKQKQKPVSH